MADETGREPTRSELMLIRQALRQDWPVPPAVKGQILQRLIDYLDRETDEGATCSDRLVIAAAKTLAAFMRLSLDQQQLDMEARKLESSGDNSLADMLKAAEEYDRHLERFQKAALEDDPGPTA